MGRVMLRDHVKRHRRGLFSFASCGLLSVLITGTHPCDATSNRQLVQSVLCRFVKKTELHFQKMESLIVSCEIYRNVGRGYSEIFAMENRNIQLTLEFLKNCLLVFGLFSEKMKKSLYLEQFSTLDFSSFRFRT